MFSPIVLICKINILVWLLTISQDFCISLLLNVLASSLIPPLYSNKHWELPKWTQIHWSDSSVWTTCNKFPYPRSPGPLIPLFPITNPALPCSPWHCFLCLKHPSPNDLSDKPLLFLHNPALCNAFLTLFQFSQMPIIPSLKLLKPC